MSVEFDTPANRIIAQQQPKNQFRIDTSLPDLAFLRQLSVQGRLRFFQGTTTGDTTDTITITPTIGETIFLYAIEITTNIIGSSTITFTNDNMTRAIYRFESGSGGNGQSYSPNFKMDSLVGDSIKQIIFRTVASVGSITISVYGWAENTSRIRDVSI